MAATPTLLNTDAVAPRDRAPQWREWVWQHFGGLESDFYGDTSLTATWPPRARATSS
jgi:hypothetical protein